MNDKLVGLPHSEISPEILGMAKRAVDATLFLAEKLSPGKKSDAFNMEIIMIAAGFKAGTSRSIRASDYDPREYEQEQEIYRQLGLELSEPQYTEFLSDAGMTKSYEFEIYNPITLKKQTLSSQLVLPYSIDMTIPEWIKRNTDSGINKGRIWGKLYSYPESAILDFDSIENFAEARRIGTIQHSDNIYPLYYGSGSNDGYIFKVPATEEIEKREKDKAQLFYIWSSNAEIQKLLDSEIF